MNRFSVVGCFVGALLCQSLMAMPFDTKNVGPEEKPDGFAIFQGCSRASTKVSSFGKISEALNAAQEISSKPTRSFTWIVTGNLEHADSMFQAINDPSKTKSCYVYSKSLRCGNWSLQSKTLTTQEAQAVAKKIKDGNIPVAIIYELE